MHATMMQTPLTIHHLIERASVLFSHVEVVSQTPAKSLVRHTYADIYRRARSLAFALQRAGLKPGMSALVDVVLSRYEDVLTIPVAAVLEIDGKHYCWVRSADRFEQRAIELGDTNDKFNVVNAVLLEGEEVALNPTAFIDEAKRKALSPTCENDNVESDPDGKPKTSSPAKV